MKRHLFANSKKKISRGYWIPKFISRECSKCRGTGNDSQNGIEWTLCTSCRGSGSEHYQGHIHSTEASKTEIIQWNRSIQTPNPAHCRKCRGSRCKACNFTGWQ